MECRQGPWWSECLRDKVVTVEISRSFSLHSLGLEFHPVWCKALFCKKSWSQNIYFKLLWVFFIRQVFCGYFVPSKLMLFATVTGLWLLKVFSYFIAFTVPQNCCMFPVTEGTWPVIIILHLAVTLWWDLGTHHCHRCITERIDGNHSESRAWVWKYVKQEPMASQVISPGIEFWILFLMLQMHTVWIILIGNLPLMWLGCEGVCSCLLMILN